MADGGKVVIKIDGDTSGFNKAIGTIGSITATGAKLAVGAIAALGSGIVALGTIGVNYNKQIETYTTNFGVMLGDTALAIEKVEQLKEMGAKTPFELPELASATEQLLAFGVANEDTQGYLQQLGDISLGNVDKLNTLVNAFGKMNSSGKVTLETINMMSEQGFNPLQEISRTTGESMESLYDRVSAGAVSLEEITGAFESATSAGGQFEGGMEKASQTTEGLISTLKDNATALVGEVFMPISEGILNDVLPSAIGAIDTLSNAFKEDGVQGLIEAGGELLAGLIVGINSKLPDLAQMAIDIIISLLDEFNANSALVGSAGGNLLTTLISGIMQILPRLAITAFNILMALVGYLKDSAPQLIASAIEMIAKLAEFLVEEIPTLLLAVLEIIWAIIREFESNSDEFFATAIELMGKLIAGLLSKLPDILNAIISIMVSLLNLIISYYSAWLGLGKDLVTYLWNGAKEIWDKFTAWIGEKLDDLLGYFDNVWEDFKDIGSNIVDGLWEGISSGWDWLTDQIDSLIDDLIGGAMDILGIASPSKVFKNEIGAMIPAGMALGIQSGIPNVKKTLASMLDISAMRNIASQAIPTISPQGNFGGSGATYATYNNDNRTSVSFVKKDVSPAEAYVRAIQSSRKRVQYGN